MKHAQGRRQSIMLSSNSTRHNSRSTGRRQFQGSEASSIFRLLGRLAPRRVHDGQCGLIGGARTHDTGVAYVPLCAPLPALHSIVCVSMFGLGGACQRCVATVGFGWCKRTTAVQCLLRPVSWPHDTLTMPRCDGSRPGSFPVLSTSNHRHPCPSVGRARSHH